MMLSIMDWDEIKRLQEASRVTDEIRRRGGFDQYREQRDILREAAERRQMGFEPSAVEQARRAREGIERYAGDIVRSSGVDDFLRRTRDGYGFERDIRERMGSLAAVSDVTRRLREGFTEPETARVLAMRRDLDERFIRESNRWNDIQRGFIPEQGFAKRAAAEAERSQLIWGTSAAATARRLGETGLISSHQRLIEEVLRPTFDYSRFAAGTVERMASASSMREAAALAGSLTLAREQIIQATAAQRYIILAPASSGYVHPEREGATPPSPTPPITIFEEEQRELLQSPEEISPDADYQTLVPLAPSAGVCEQNVRCQVLLGMCNEASMLRNEGEIFATTNKVRLACAHLSLLVARDRTTINSLIMYLSTILYESAGSDHLRFLERGFVSSEESEVIWTIKALRNKWIEHDPDHGTPSNITKSWRTLDQALQSLGFSRTPVTPEEHTELQTRLLNKVEQFLRLLVERIGAAPRPTPEG
jgi:hypothetical protein